MELAVRDGDYCLDGRGGLKRAGSEELLQRVLWKLSIRRGSFPFLPDLGSDLWRLNRARPSERPALARQYAVQALSDEPGLKVTGVQLEEDGQLWVSVERNEISAEVRVKL